MLLFDEIIVIYCMLAYFATPLRHLKVCTVSACTNRYRSVSGLRYRMALPTAYSGESLEYCVVFVELHHVSL